MSEQPSNEEIEAARFAALLPAVTKSFFTSILSITIFSALLFRFSPTGLSLWLALRAVVSIACVVTLKRLPSRAQTFAQQQTTIVAVLAISGIVWGLIPAFVTPAGPEWRAVTVLWLFGNQSVITAVCSASKTAFRAAAGSVTFVGAAAVALPGDSFGFVLAALLLLGGVYSSSISVSIHRVVTAAITGQLETAALAASLTQRQGELEAANRELDELASRDGLTRLPNRRSFTETVSDGEGHVRIDGWLGFIDLDHFKAINDSMGHAVGDLVLITVANRWSPLLPQGAMLARTGGDEFALFVPGGSADAVRDLCFRFIASLQQTIDIDDSRSTSASCSIGICRAEAGDTFSTAMARADTALYRVKSDGRNDVGMLEHTDESAPPLREGQDRRQHRGAAGVLPERN